MSIEPIKYWPVACECYNCKNSSMHILYPTGFNALSDFNKMPISTIIVHQLELLIVIIQILGTMP